MSNLVEKIYKKVLDADVYSVALQTPLQKAIKLSKHYDANIIMKREDLQPVHSFKIRGALNKINTLTDEQKRKGIITASAGNHAQGVAMSAKNADIEATIVMPQTTPEIKSNAVRGFGAEVVLHGDNYSEAAEKAQEIVETTDKTYVHPFDDEDVIAGQGTVGKEILDVLPEVDYIFMPIGGGGLIAGVGAYVKSVNPKVKIIGVEPNDSNAMTQSVDLNELTELSHVGIFADGVAVKKPGELPFSICKQVVDEFVNVTTDQMCSAIKDIFEETRLIVEPSGALALAGVKKFAQHNDIRGKNIVVINSGANMTFERLKFVAERTLAGSGKEAIYAIELPEHKGALSEFCASSLGEHSITEFNYRIADPEKAFVFLGVGIADETDKQKLEKVMAGNNYNFTSLRRDELAKEHVRYMIGGQGLAAPNELLLRFEFPERPGALSEFLEAMGDRWSITLFHYRAVGGDIGRVLMGFEVTESERKEFIETLGTVSYEYENVTEDEAYKTFLR